MIVFEKIQDLRAHLNVTHSTKRIGLVPTMGALHQGHLSLVALAQKSCELVVVSVFVNPTQFNNPADLAKYPSDFNKDKALLEAAGVDVIFAPSPQEIYPEKPSLTISFGPLEQQLEGEFRSGHFAGVGIIVGKLFNIVQPNHAFFGQKDLQQFYIIKKLVDEMNFDIELTLAPIIREQHGLAMSSRNERLSTSDRADAALIYQTLNQAKENIRNGLPLRQVTAKVFELFANHERFKLEYFEVINTKNFESIEDTESAESIALCLAAEIGGIRLIDNLLLND